MTVYIPFALQLYSIKDDAKKDLAGCLEKVKAMGYDGVEFAGYHEHSAAQLKDMLDSNGLKPAGTHISIDTLLGDELEKTIEFNKAYGNTYLIVPGLAEFYRNSRDAWKKTGEIFSGIAEKAKAAGMKAGYHNHNHEFTELDGEIPIITFLENSSDDVIMQFDNGNALHGGYDINPLISKYAGRAKTVHCKEFSKEKGWKLPGQGDIDWKAFGDACRADGGTEWFIVEQEDHEFEPLVTVEKALENVKGLIG